MKPKTASVQASTTCCILAADRTWSLFLKQQLTRVGASVSIPLNTSELKPALKGRGPILLLVDGNLSEDWLRPLADLFASPRPGITLLGLRNEKQFSTALEQIGLQPAAYLSWPFQEEIIAALAGLHNDEAPGRIMTMSERLELLVVGCRRLAHAINNPLTPIMGESQLAVMRGMADPERTLLAFHKIEHEACRIRDKLAAFETLRNVAKDGILPTNTIQEFMTQIMNEPYHTGQ